MQYHMHEKHGDDENIKGQRMHHSKYIKSGVELLRWHMSAFMIWIAAVWALTGFLSVGNAQEVQEGESEIAPELIAATQQRLVGRPAFCMGIVSRNVKSFPLTLAQDKKEDEALMDELNAYVAIGLLRKSTINTSAESVRMEYALTPLGEAHYRTGSGFSTSVFCFGRIQITAAQVLPTQDGLPHDGIVLARLSAEKLDMPAWLFTDVVKNPMLKTQMNYYLEYVYPINSVEALFEKVDGEWVFRTLYPPEEP